MLTESAPNPSEKDLYETMKKFLETQPDQRVKRQSAYKRPGFKKDLFEGDVVLHKKNLEGLQREATIRELTWPDGVVPYTIEISDQNAVGLIEDAFREIMDKSCLKFREKESDDQFYLKYTYGEGCASSVGRSGMPGGQEVYLGEGCFNPGTIRHETLHSLGFYHEQSRTDRDDYIKILWDNVEPGLEDQFLKSNKREVTDLGSPYDYGSIMHYPWNAFASDDTQPTITKMDGSTKGFGQRVGFSPIDLYELNKLYNCPGTGAPPKSAKPKKVGTTQKPPASVTGNSWIDRWTQKIKTKANLWLAGKIGDQLASFITGRK
uniref:Metalloendopeptidase n=1 Tax=Plectus sambesii TaxID=2011161 RepID=A0A914XHD7_9BILA